MICRRPVYQHRPMWVRPAIKIR